MRLLPRVLWLTLGMLAASAGFAQVIQFESGGLTYQTLTRGGLTIMFAHMPIRIRDYGMIQVAASNGSSQVLKIRPQDFQFRLSDGRILRGVPAADVIGRFIRSASSSDVIKLVTTYEAGLYGMGRIRSTNGYEKRRQAALAVVSSKRLKAAAAASAIALVETEPSRPQFER